MQQSGTPALVNAQQIVFRAKKNIKGEKNRLGVKEKEPKGGGAMASNATKDHTFPGMGAPQKTGLPEATEQDCTRGLPQSVLLFFCRPT